MRGPLVRSGQKKLTNEVAYVLDALLSLSTTEHNLADELQERLSLNKIIMHNSFVLNIVSRCRRWYLNSSRQFTIPTLQITFYASSSIQDIKLDL